MPNGGTCYIHKETNKAYCDGPPPGSEFLEPNEALGSAEVVAPVASGSTDVASGKVVSGSNNVVFQDPIVAPSFPRPNEASGSTDYHFVKPMVLSSFEPEEASGPAKEVLGAEEASGPTKVVVQNTKGIGIFVGDKSGLAAIYDYGI